LFRYFQDRALERARDIEEKIDVLGKAIHVIPRRYSRVLIEIPIL
jgi:hypothetical protein